MVKSSLKKQLEKSESLKSGLASRLFPKRIRHASDSEAPPASSSAAEMSIEGFDAAPGSAESRQPEAKRSRSPKSPQLPKPKSPRFSKPWHWSLVWLAALFALGGMGTAALVWLVSLPPQVDCRDPAHLSLDMERLYCAQEAAQSGDIAKLVAGIELLQQWQPDHPLHHEAQRLINEWSEQVFTHAIRKVEKGDLKGAESAISHIPANTEIYPDTQKALERWRKYSKIASGIYAKAQTALKQKDWATVSQQIVALAEFERDYWELAAGADAVAQQLGVEKQAWQSLSRAQRMAASNDPSQINAAIPIAQQIPAKTYAAATAKTNLKQWSQKLVTLANQKWQQGKRSEALATLKLAPKVVNTPEIADLYQFSHAYLLANSALSEQWIPSIGDILNLKEAIAAVGQVKSDSPFYGQAQANKRAWQAQVQDLIQLKYAGAVASLGQHDSLELAIGQAKQIDPQRPLRLQAQSLIAYWQNELERIEDQPIVDRAIRIAKPGSIEALKAAMAEASNVQLGRSLRGRAQTLIATWRAKIETIEDQPILDQAWQLAGAGQLETAIQTASNISAGRALYREAQAAIGEWRQQQITQAQIAQDQPILDRANTMAEAGNLAGAINTAEQISSGRALYGRAQSLIDEWQEQLAPPPAPIEPPSSYDYYTPTPDNSGNSPTDSVPFPTPAGATDFPSPVSPQLANPMPPLELESPVTTYEPVPQPADPFNSGSIEPSPMAEPPDYVPAPPPDPLPPGPPIDPLPPNP